MIEITSKEQLEKEISENDGILLYFSGENCSVVKF